MNSTKSDASPPPPVNKPNHESHPPNGSLPKRKRKPSQSVASPVAATTPEDRPSALKRKRVVDNLEKEKTPTPNGQHDTGVSSSQRNPVNRGSAGPGPRSFSKEISAKRVNRALSAAANGGSPAPSTVSEGLNKGRLHRSNGEAGKNGVTGAFQPEEVEAIEEFKVRFCNSFGLSTTTFDLIVQHGKGPFPGPPGVTKYTFWQEVHSILPNRDKRSVRRFMKRHFQASNQKPHEWTEEQEDELVVLYHQHGPKWAYISELLGRSSDDVVQRWKNRLEHRSTMNVGPWSEGELSLLKKVLRDAWSKMQEQGYNVGDSIYEMDESLISWGQVSVGMKHTRSRQQCADKWRRVKGSRTTQGSRANSRANSQSVSRSATPSQANREGHRGRKSAAYVVSDDDDSDAGDNADNKKDAAEHSTRETPASKTLNKPKKLESKQEESESSPESDSESESEATKSEATLNKKPSSSGEKGSMPESKQPSSTSSSEASDSSSDSDSDSDSNSDSESDSESTGNNKTKSAPQKHEGPEVTGHSKREASSDETDDSSSEEGESESENESPDEIPATPSPEPTEEETSKGAKRRRSNSATMEVAEAGDKRVKVKKERSPTPSAVVAPEHEHEHESESRDQDAKLLKREDTAESETSSESESDSKEQDAKKREGSSESETSSDSDAESDSSEPSTNDEAESKNTTTQRTPQPEDTEMKTSSLSDYEVSSDSDADSTSPSDSEDEANKKGSKVTGGAEPATAAPAIKKETDSDSSSDETSSSDTSSEPDSDSDSDSE